MNLSSRLQARERELGRPVRIGLAGAGQMGIGFVAQVRRIPGMEVAAIADVLPGRPQAAFAQAGINGVVEGDDPDKLAQAVAETVSLALGSSLVEASIETNGDPAVRMAGKDPYRLIEERGLGTADNPNFEAFVPKYNETQDLLTKYETRR